MMAGGDAPLILLSRTAPRLFNPHRFQRYPKSQEWPNLQRIHPVIPRYIRNDRNTFKSGHGQTARFFRRAGSCRASPSGRHPGLIGSFGSKNEISNTSQEIKFIYLFTRGIAAFFPPRNAGSAMKTGKNSPKRKIIQKIKIITIGYFY